MKGLFITGSNTDVGKTFVAQHIISLLAESQQVFVRKPVESDCSQQNGTLVTKDAKLLAAVANSGESIDKVCAYKFSSCSSPEMASKEANSILSLNDLVVACQSKEPVVVEGAGGILSPIAEHALNIDLIQELNLPIVLIVKDELGAVNQALLALSATRSRQLNVAMLVLNQVQPNCLNNESAISQYSDANVIVFNAKKLENFNTKAKSIFKKLDLI